MFEIEEYILGGYMYTNFYNMGNICYFGVLHFLQLYICVYKHLTNDPYIIELSIPHINLVCEVVQISIHFILNALLGLVLDF